MRGGGGESQGTDPDFLEGGGSIIGGCHKKGGGSDSFGQNFDKYLFCEMMHVRALIVC